MSGSDDLALDGLARRAGEVLLQRRQMVAVAESCTGGWVAKCLTDIAGSSQWFERGYVTYSNAAKEQALGVAAERASRPSGRSAVRRPSRWPPERCMPAAPTLAVAITGIAGPDGGTPGQAGGPGLVCAAHSATAPPVAVKQHFEGDREAIRRAAVATALRLMHRRRFRCAPCRLFFALWPDSAWRRT